MTVLDTKGHPIPITASFGLAVLQSGERPDSVIDRADRAMYAGKTAGRNCVRISSVADKISDQLAAS
jgi:diguanylate cyclase